MVIIPENVYQLKNIVVLISGKAGAGKTTVAESMLSGIPPKYSAIISSFALGVKNVAYGMGWNGVKDEAGRRLLQQIGNAGRDYDKNIWVKTTMELTNEMANPLNMDFLFIDDWRFPNEYNWFEDKKDIFSVYKIRVHREAKYLSNASDPDISENALPEGMSNYYFGHIVNKNMNIDELRAYSRLMLQSIIDKEFIN